jgi:hypothetical protein
MLFGREMGNTSRERSWRLLGAQFRGATGPAESVLLSGRGWAPRRGHHRHCITGQNVTPLEYSRSMPAPSRHHRGGRRDESLLRRCNRADSLPLRRDRCRLQVSLPEYGERRMPSMPSYGDGSRRGEPTGATRTGSGSRRCLGIDQCDKCHREPGREDLWKVYAEQWLAVLR